MHAAEQPSAAVRSALDWAAAAGERVVAETCELAAIPAPTFGEARRAAYVAARLRALGLADVRTDAVGNVVGVRPGRGDGARLLLMAHLDTVFAEATPLQPMRDAGRLRCPGVGDNAAAVAALLALAEGLDAAGVVTAGPVYFAATVGEEGLGNLRGAWAVCEALAGEVDAAIALEGHFLGRVVHEAVGSQRFNLVFSGPGGHSWEDLEQHSAIHALGRAVAGLVDLPLSHQPRATLNVGTIDGGSGLNVVAARATAGLDLRSTDQAVLDALVGRARAVVEAAAQQEGVAVVLEDVGARPAGRLAPEHPLVAHAARALRAVSIEPVLTASSTDANVPLALGVPAVSLGITRGGGMHTLEEWIELSPIVQGLQQLMLVVASLTDLPRGSLQVSEGGAS